MSGAGPLRGFPFGPPPPSACFGPPAPCSRRGRAVLGFSGYALPLPREEWRRRAPPPPPPRRCGRARQGPTPRGGAAARVRPSPRGRCGWARRAAPRDTTDRPPRSDRPNRPSRPRADRPNREGRPSDHRARSALVARSLLARSSLAARCARRGAERSDSPEGAARGEAPHTPSGLMGRTARTERGYKKTCLGVRRWLAS